VEYSAGEGFLLAERPVMKRAAGGPVVDRAAIAAIIGAGREQNLGDDEVADQILQLMENPTWAKALSHPTRGEILRLLREDGPYSPVRATECLPDVTLGTAAYHFRTLQRLGLIEVCGEHQRRGAVEHVYRLVA